MIVDKFFNYEINAFNVSAQIIEILTKSRVMNVSALFNKITTYNTEVDQDVLLKALGLLYLTGKIEYNLDTDNMEIRNEISKPRV
jgi:hypothetical protein